MYVVETLNEAAEWITEDNEVYDRLSEADYEATVKMITYGEICRVVEA